MQGLTAWRSSPSALILVTALAAVELFADAFNRPVCAIRRGVPPLSCAATYLSRNTTVDRRAVIASVPSTAAAATSYKDMVDRLIMACSSPVTVRRVRRESLQTLDGPSIPEAGDSRMAFRASGRRR